jgi:signal transduction histidine kinase
MLRRSLLPGFRIIALVSMATLVPLVGLGWFGWRWLAQDEDNQMRRQLDAAAGRAAVAIERVLVAAEERLRAGAVDWPPGAVTISVSGAQPAVAPRERVAYLPAVDPLPDDVGARFAEIASRVSLAPEASESRAVGTALSDYAMFLDIDDAGVAGTPAALAARYARCRLFERTGNIAGLRAEANLLQHDLERGRWPLTSAVYFLYVKDARTWTGRLPQRPRLEESLAEAVSLAYAQRPAGLTPKDWEAARRSAMDAGEASFVVLWQPIAEGLRALVASEDFVAREWMAAAASVAQASGTTVLAIEPGEGYRAGEAVSANALTIVRASESGLPWDLRVTARDPANLDPGLRSRRRLLVAGFAVFSVMTMVAGYAVVRGVGREMAAARQQSEFLAAVSHEFRTPLTTLRQFTDRLAEQPAMPEAGKLVCVNAQARATERLTRLVESLLDVGRMEVGAQPYTFAPLDLTPLVRRVVAEFEADAGAAGREIRTSADDVVIVSGDAAALARVIWNLIDNAVKYSPGQPVVDVSVRRTGDRVAVAVRDYGIGVPHGERDMVFRKFQRGVDARARGINGTGLGLAIVAHIVAAHHGRVEVDSVEGQGSTFTVMLPL